MCHIRVSKKADEGAKLYWLNHPDFSTYQPLSRVQAQAFLPQFVLGYASGENEILSLPFFKMRFLQLDEYLNHLKNSTSYPGQPESRHICLDNSFSQAVLICNLIFEEEEALRPFRHEVGLKSLQQFRIILKRRIAVSVDEVDDYSKDAVIIEEDENQITNYYVHILKEFEATETPQQRFGPLVTRLQRCATCFYHEPQSDTLYLDYKVDEATKAAFKSNFASAIELFQAFRTLLTLNLYAVSKELKRDVYRSKSLYVNETVPTLASDQRIMRFKFVKFEKEDVPGLVMMKDLSDGEHQFIHSLGLCLLFRNTSSLFLLDEPETHFNPDWRSKFISRLRQCFDVKDSRARREMLITTHTPFLISDSRPEKVLVFEKEQGQVSVSQPTYNTLGASVDQITMVTFKKRETIGARAAAYLEHFKRRFEGGESGPELIRDIHRELGDSVEKMLLIRLIKGRMAER